MCAIKTQITQVDFQLVYLRKLVSTISMIGKYISVLSKILVSGLMICIELKNISPIKTNIPKPNNVDLDIDII